MKICNTCMEYHTDVIGRANTEIEECSVQECEIGHPKMKPQLSKKIIKILDQVKAKTINIDGPEWGWAYIAPSYSVYYWWLESCDLSPCDHCDTKRPDHSKACDIHYEPWMWIEDIEAWMGGLINFGGSRQARNCGGDGGLVNSKRNGECLKKYSDAPEVWKDGWLWGRVANTNVTDCIFRCQYILLDYVPVETKYTLIEKICRRLRIH